MVKVILFRIVKSLRFKKPVRVIRMSQSIQPNSNCLFPILRYKVPPYDIGVPLSFLRETMQTIELTELQYPAPLFIKRNLFPDLLKLLFRQITKIAFISEDSSTRNRETAV